MSQKAVVLLSGGQDSTTSLYWALRYLTPVAAMIFDYGQRHRDEIDAARAIADRAEVRAWVAELSVLSQIADSALTRPGLDVAAGGGYLGLPSTYTPARNLLFLTAAAALAQKMGAHHLVTGVCQTDFSGYPDCRRATVDALEHALLLGTEWPLRIHTPLMYLTKAQTVALARELPGCWEALALTVTCYHGRRPGCGECPACRLRARGFAEAGEEDPAAAAAAR